MADTLVGGLFERHHMAVYRYFRRMTGHHDLAQDLAQETFFRVVRGLGADTQLRSETAFLFLIAHNVLVDHWRKTAAAPETNGSVDSIGVGPRHLSALTLQEALAWLPERDREAFVLREVEGLSYPEIATASGATIESVRSRLRRARASLRVTLADRLVGATAQRTAEDEV